MGALVAGVLSAGALEGEDTGVVTAGDEAGIVGTLVGIVTEAGVVEGW